jgi:two-component system capsular synthesis sensor histidine kinase RcsC
MRQILSNLVSNAIKFTHSGSVLVTVDGFVNFDKFHLQIKVRDDGIGIPPEAITSMFEGFTQGDGSIQRKYGGTGLGLTISKNLAELMGGTLSAESQVGNGTTMILKLSLDLAPSDFLVSI